MDIKEIKKLKIGKLIENVDLRDYTTYKAGGKGKVLVIPEDIEKVASLFNKDKN